VYSSGSSSIPVDYNLYRKFWSLQDFFRRPAQCYEKFAWKTFSSVCHCFLLSLLAADDLEFAVLILYAFMTGNTKKFSPLIKLLKLIINWLKTNKSQL